MIGRYTQLLAAAILDIVHRGDCDCVSKTELQAAEQRSFIKELNGSEKTTKSRSRRLNPPSLTALPSEERVN
jgi:hypothetical protein